MMHLLALASRLLPSFSILIILTIPARCEAAGWIEDHVRKLATAAGDVVSLCATCRERDRLKAERAEDAARKAREAAEELRRTQIREISVQLAAQDAVLTGQAVSLSLAWRLVQLQNAVLGQVTNTLDERNASLSAIEFVKDFLRAGSSSELTALTEAVALKPPTQTEIEQEGSANGAGTSAALRSLQTFIKAHDTADLVASSYLSDAISALKTTTLRELLQRTTEARRVSLELRQQLYNELQMNTAARDGTAQRLMALGVTVSPTPESVVVGLKEYGELLGAPKAPGDAPQRTAELLATIETKLDAARQAQVVPLADDSAKSSDAEQETPDVMCARAFEGMKLNSIRIPCPRGG